MHPQPVGHRHPTQPETDMHYLVTYQEPKRPKLPRARVTYRVDAETKDDAIYIANKAARREVPGASLLSVKIHRGEAA